MKEKGEQPVMFRCVLVIMVHPFLLCRYYSSHPVCLFFPHSHLGPPKRRPAADEDDRAKDPKPEVRYYIGHGLIVKTYLLDTYHLSCRTLFTIILH